MAPHYANGKICYLEIPASDVGASSSFYAEVFGWSLREHPDGTSASTTASARSAACG